MSARNPAPPLSFVRPLLPSLVAEPPEGDGWLHEVKHDGYRTILVVQDGRARASTRNGHDWTARFGGIPAAAATLGCRSAILDGEMIVQDERGVSDIAALRTAMSSAPHRLLYYAFDLLHLDGRDLRLVPLTERRVALEKLIDPAAASSAIQFTEAIAGDGAKVFAAADRLGLEGIVSKRASSRYKSGPSTSWLKTKCMTEGEFIVVGMEPNPGGPPFALLARETEAGLAYAGSAFVTLPQPARDRFWRETEALKIPRPVLRRSGAARRASCGRR